MQQLPKSLFIFVFCVPLAIVFGILLATPLDRTTLLMVMGVFFLLLTPIFLTKHHEILVVSWNAYVNAFFLPGKPYIWMLAVAASSVFMILTRALNRGKLRSLHVPSITLPLLFIGLVTYATSVFTGGIGSQALGSEVYGGKRYIFLWGAIFGYFALSLVPIDPKKAQWLAGAFFISSVTAVVSNVAYMLGERFYFLFLLFPVEWALPQAASEYAVGGFARIGGLAPASVAVASFMLLRYGVRGTFHIRYPWRSILFVGAVVAGMFSGFRATFLLVMVLFALQFFAEGLHKTKQMLVLVAVVSLTILGLLPFANRLPLSVQRCLTMFPIDLDRAAIDAARGSTEWRLEMWRAVVPDIPMYFWLGKGFAIDPKDLYFSQQNISLRSHAPYEASLIAGDYHSGPLTLLIPFGIWGVLAFTWFCAAAIRVLWKNYRYGDESIVNINRFLLVAFIAKLIFFIFIFGAFYLDLMSFTGIVALSIAINHGVAEPFRRPAFTSIPVKKDPEPEPIAPPPGWQPAFQRGMLPSSQG